jgi:hypothetical protein
VPQKSRRLDVRFHLYVYPLLFTVFTFPSEGSVSSSQPPPPCAPWKRLPICAQTSLIYKLLPLDETAPKDVSPKMLGVRGSHTLCGRQESLVVNMF